MNDTSPRGIRAPIALLAALGTLLIGLAGGAAVGGMLGYVAGQRAAGGDVEVPAAIERLGLVPRAAQDGPSAASAASDDGDGADVSDASDDSDVSAATRDSDATDLADDADDADDAGASDDSEPSASSDGSDDSDAPAPNRPGRSKGGRQSGMADARPRLGVEVATEPLAKGDYASGARVMTVADRSAAAAAGIRAGDVIVAVDGEPVRTSDELADAIAARAPGDAVAIVVLRGGAERTIEATLGAGQP